MNDHRVPPKPAHFDTAPEGTCRWCNEKIGLTKTGRESKSRWHPKCVTEYKMLFHPSTTRREVWRRDKGVCRGCGAVCARKGAPKWHMDHIIPLIQAKGELKYWRLPNLQTLCTPCHSVKTSREATERAVQRRLLKEKNLK